MTGLPTVVLLFIKRETRIYALGITVWEIIKNGCSYTEENWLMHGESNKEFLHRTSMDEGPDAIRKCAEDFISILSDECGLCNLCDFSGVP